MKKTASTYNVLVVDDVSENIQVLGGILYPKGFNISMAQSGREALNIVARKPPDVILLDVMMPEMDGFEVCKQLKSMPESKDIPVIFITANSQPEDIAKAFELGAADYITKPFDPSELCSRVFTQLERRSN